MDDTTRSCLWSDLEVLLSLDYILLRQRRTVSNYARTGVWMLLLDRVIKDDLKDELTESEFELPNNCAIKDVKDRWRE